MTVLLYLACILIWGASWIAISFQLGDVPVLTSIFYRFSLAALILLPALFALKKIQPTTKHDHAWFFAQGLCFFSLNFLCFYLSTQYIQSGVVAIIFSMVLLFNCANRWLFLRQSTSKLELLSMLVGIAGLIILFWRELVKNNFSETFILGIGFALLGTLIFSLGNMISVRNAQKSLSVFTSTGYSMFYGASVLLVALVVTGTPFAFSTQPSYMISLVYLAIFASVIGFTTYITLIKRIGVNKATYCMVVFPVVAIGISIVYEGYQWDASTVIGMAVILSGNFLMASKYWLEKVNQMPDSDVVKQS